ncbi:MAG: hypothetical protein ACI97A_000708 [Planctomycetota bacterium]|jgi:hypothetical protein
MADPIRFVEAIAPLARVVKERQRSREEKQLETPRDGVSLSHLNDQRTLKLLQQIFADSLGHRSISTASQNAGMPKDTDHVVTFLLEQINTVLVEPYLELTTDIDADAFSQYVRRIVERLDQGKAEIEAVFKSLDLASVEHLQFVDEVGSGLNEALTELDDETRLEFSNRY